MSAPTPAGRRARRPLTWWLVLLLILLLPLLPIYLWWQGRLNPRWATALVAVCALFWGAALFGPKTEQETGEPPLAEAVPSVAATPTQAPTSIATATATEVAGFADVDTEDSDQAVEKAAAERAAARAAKAKKAAARKAEAKRKAEAQRKAAAEAKRKADAKAKAEAKRKADAAAAAAARTDPRFDTCGDANAAGYGNYVAGVDPEYDWYQDRDSDGRVCETG